jgi:DNA polymerase-1
MSTRPSAMPTLYLIDGSAYIYRAYFGLPALSNSKGLQTNAIYGFTTMLMKILRDRRPDGLAVVFDEKGPTQRHEEFKAYKAHRPEMQQGMRDQIPYIHRVVETFGIPAVRAAGYEADDLIGTLARQAEAAGFEVVIVTGDKDMFQLLTPATRIYDPVKDKWFGEAECRERFGVEPARVVEVMGLMGDQADNIPGVKGIGEKTATKLIAQFGTIENLLAHLDDGQNQNAPYRTGGECPLEQAIGHDPDGLSGGLRSGAVQGRAAAAQTVGGLLSGDGIPHVAQGHSAVGCERRVTGGGAGRPR